MFFDDLCRIGGFRTAIGFAANGFGDFTPPGDAGAAPKICQMCDGAGSFKAGDCKVGSR